MCLFLTLTLFCISFASFAQTEPALKVKDSEQQILKLPDSEEPQRLRVAVIGAGAAGASFAHHIHRVGTADSSAIIWDVEVFEKTAQAGGRALTVNVFDDPNLAIEVGASIFIEENRILQQAVTEFRLDTYSLRKRSDPSPTQRIGVWDGQSFRLIIDERDSWWKTSFQLVWKYGLSILNARSLAASALTSFLRMYDAPIFPFHSLVDAVSQAGVQKTAARYADAYLEQKGISRSFAIDLIQASTRVNYAQDISSIHALAALACMSIQDAKAVKDGNWQIFSMMLQGANATVNRQTTVTDIRKDKDGKMLVGYTKQNENTSNWEIYDNVVIAAPFESSGLRSYFRPQRSPRYVELHVTLLASSVKLSPRFFGMLKTDHVPEVVLTTHLQSKEPFLSSKPIPFLSISLVRSIEPCDNPTRTNQYVYKIFSTEHLANAFVSSLFDPKYDMGGPTHSINTSAINWIHRKTWQSYPYLDPVEEFEDPQLDDNLWYTAGMETLLSAMESMALMGKNVAHLMHTQAEAAIRSGASRPTAISDRFEDQQI